MRSKITRLMVTVLVALLAAVMTAGASTAQPRQTRALLFEIAKEAISAQGKAHAGKGMGELLSGAHIKSYRDFLLGKMGADAGFSGRFMDYEGFFEAKGVELRGKTAVVKLLEHGVLTFSNPEKDPAVPAAQEYEFEHEVRFVQRKGLWTLTGDEIVNLPQPAAPDHSSGVSAPLPSTSPLFIRNPAPEVEEKAYSLNRTTVANYALQYWSSYNTSYRSFSPTDCTNFVSQAVRAGGWTDVTGWYQDSTSWWYNSLNQSYPWVNANLWGQFTYNRPRASIAAYVSDLRVGDVLEADWDRDGTIDHAMVVTSKSANDIYLTYHSNNTKNKPFSELLAGNPNASWYGYLLSASGD